MGTGVSDDERTEGQAMKLYRVYSDLTGLDVAGRLRNRVRVHWFVERYDDELLRAHVGRCAPAAQEEDYLTSLEVAHVKQYVEARWPHTGEAVVVEDLIDTTTDLGRLETMCLEGRQPYREQCRLGAPRVALHDPEAADFDDALAADGITLPRICGFCEV